MSITKVKTVKIFTTVINKSRMNFCMNIYFNRPTEQSKVIFVYEIFQIMMFACHTCECFHQHIEAESFDTLEGIQNLLVTYWK